MNWKIILCGAVCTVVAVRAELPPDTVCAIHEANKDSVLMLSGTLKFQYGRLHEVQVEGPATVVDAHGLLLTSSSTVPIPLSDRKTEIRESTVKVKLPSGQEVPVRVVLTDGDLNAVLLAPENPAGLPAGVFKPVNWNNTAKAQTMEVVVLVGRMDKIYGGLPDTAPAKINAVDTKPRTRYICATLASGDGEAAFNSAGQLIGVGLGRQTIVAADELQDVIEQARRVMAKGEEKKTGAKE
jgi:hypothetical protein